QVADASSGVEALAFAAELLGASCGPEGAPAEIVVPGRRRAQSGLLVREESIPETETRTVGGVVVTDERRTARPGLPAPVLQHPVGPYRLDLAYPGPLLAIEYDGGEHRTAKRALHDLRREAHLTREGWVVLRFTAYQVLCRPDLVAATVHCELIRRGMIAA
ncbi:MAG: endonuclease domain-containing protein, partial [Pseudonocardia sp.]|nr:endonuclease domain-containing protein [Pseudonocardia sp.]